jgi:hypothetical protein
VARPRESSYCGFQGRLDRPLEMAAIGTTRASGHTRFRAAVRGIADIDLDDANVQTIASVSTMGSVAQSGRLAPCHSRRRRSGHPLRPPGKVDVLWPSPPISSPPRRRIVPAGRLTWPSVGRPATGAGSSRCRAAQKVPARPAAVDRGVAANLRHLGQRRRGCRLVTRNEPHRVCFIPRGQGACRPRKNRPPRRRGHRACRQADADNCKGST